MNQTWARVPISSVAYVNPSLPRTPTSEESVSFLAMSDVGVGMILRRQTRSANEVMNGFTQFADGDVLVAKITPCFENGKGCICSCLENEIGFGSTEFIVLRPKEGVDGTFLYYHTISDRFRLAGAASMVGSAGQKRLQPGYVRTYVIPLPPLSAQKAIAQVLSTWDRGIRQLTDLIAAKLRFKQGLMQQLLTGKKRITPRVKHGISEPLLGSSPDNSIVSLEVEFGITGKSFQEGIPAVNICPSGWTQHSFCDLFEVVQRPAELREEATYQLVTAKRYRGGIVPREQLRGEQIKTKTQFFVATGDFLISKRQIIHGACGMVPASLDGAVVSNEYACLRPSCELDPGFLHYLIHTRYFQQTCFHASVGVTLEKMIFRLDQWLKHLVNLPPLEDQRAIADCLSTMDYEILLLARQRRLLKQQKKGMMQKLLTGEVRVKLSKGVV